MLFGRARNRPLLDGTNVPFLDRVQKDSLVRKHWEILGPDSIGDKAGNLLVKTRYAIKSGFTPNERVVLAMGFFEEYYSRNVKGASGKREQILNGVFSTREMESIDQIAGRFKGRAVVVRSSAFGDALGIGVYESRFVLDTSPEGISKAIKEVLASQYTDDAVEYRRVRGLPEGMAVIIEPVVATLVNEGHAPNFSGIGFTKLPNGTSLLRVTAGLGTMVVRSTYGIKITYSNDKLEMPWFVGLKDDFTSLPEETLRMLHGKVIEGAEGTSRVEVNSKSLVKRFIYEPRKLFAKMGKFEELCGVPQYIEWAGIYRPTNPLSTGGMKFEVTLLQTADAKREDFVEVPKNPKNVLAETNYVMGSGRKECPELVVVRTENSIPALRRYNGDHKGYAVAYDGKLHTGENPKLSFHDLSNASVVIDYGFAHIKDPASHWEGLMKATSKIFLVTDLDEGVLEKLREEGKTGNIGENAGLYVANFVVSACMRQQRAVVEVQE